MPVSFIDPKPFIENIMEGDRHDRWRKNCWL